MHAQRAVAVEVDHQRQRDRRDVGVARVEAHALAAAALDLHRGVRPGGVEADAEPVIDAVLDVGRPAGARRRGESRCGRGAAGVIADARGPLDEGAENEGAGAEAEAPSVRVRRGGEEEEQEGERQDFSHTTRSELQPESQGLQFLPGSSLRCLL